MLAGGWQAAAGSIGWMCVEDILRWQGYDRSALPNSEVQRVIGWLSAFARGEAKRQGQPFVDLITAPKDLDRADSTLDLRSVERLARRWAEYCEAPWD